MGLDHRREIGSSSANATAAAAANAAGIPGKRTGTDPMAAVPVDELLRRVKAQAGTELEDGRGFRFTARADGSFAITAAPPELAQAVGHDIQPGGNLARLWTPLAMQLANTERGQAPRRVPPEALDAGSFVSAIANTNKKHDGHVAVDYEKLTASKKTGTESTDVRADGSRTKKFDTTDTEVGLEGGSRTEKKGTTTEIVDIRATSAAAQKELAAELALAKQQRENVAKDEQLDRPAKLAAMREVRFRITALENTIAILKQAPEDAAALRDAYAVHHLTSEPKYRVVAEDSVTSKDKLAVDWAHGGATLSSDTTATSTEGGKITANTNKSSTAIRLGAGTFEHSSSETQTITQESGKKVTETVRPSETHTASIGGGAATYKSTKTEGKTITNAEGEKVFEKKHTKGTDNSLVANEKDGIGWKTGASSSSEESSKDSSRKKDVDGHVAITDKGVLADASAGYKGSGKHVEGSVKAKANGAFTIEVVPPREPDGLYHVVTTLRAGLDSNGKLGKKKEEEEGKGKSDKLELEPEGSLGAKAGASLVYSHAMTLEQVNKYQDAADAAAAGRAAQGDGEFPEFGLLAKLNLIAHGDHNLDQLTLSSDGASKLPVGDSVKLTLTAGVSGKLGGDGKYGEGGAGLEIAGELGYTRTLSLSRAKDGKVVVTVGFIATDKLEGSVSGSLVGATAKISGSTEQSDGDEFSFKLDPNDASHYKTWFDKITGAKTRAALRALLADKQLAEQMASTKHTDEHQTGREFQAGVKGVNMAMGTTRQGSSDVVKSEEGPEGSYSGGTTNSATLKLGDTAVAGATETNTASVSVESSGEMTADLQTKRTESDSLRTFANLGKTVKGWFGIEDDKDTDAKKVLMGALEKTPGERLDEVLGKQYERLSGYKLSAHDVEILLVRAENEDKWMGACASARAIAPMRHLMYQLLDPPVDMTLVNDDHDLSQLAKATKLARAKAIADFMESTGSYGMEALVNVLQNYGGTLTREAKTTDLGSHYEWPESLADEHARFDRTVAGISRLTASFDDLSQRPDGADQWYHRSELLIGELDKVHRAIESSQDFHSERARAEMLDDISGRIATVRAGRSYFQRAQGFLAARGELSPVNEEAEHKVGLQMFANERIPTLLADLKSYKIRERQLFTQVDRALGDGDRHHATDILAQVRDLYEFWVTRVLELRGAYNAANIASDQWKVSKGPEAKHLVASTEPEVGRMIELWREAGGDAYQGTNWAAEWKQRFAAY